MKSPSASKPLLGLKFRCKHASSQILDTPPQLQTAWVCYRAIRRAPPALLELTERRDVEVGVVRIARHEIVSYHLVNVTNAHMRVYC